MTHFEENGLVIRDAKIEDLRDLAERMRKEDASELWASFHWTPTAGAIRSFENSREKVTIEYKGKVAGVFGVVPVGSLLSARGVIWLLTTETVNEMKVMFARKSKAVIAWLMSDYRLLENFVDARHVACVRWLKWAGANLNEARPWGADGLPFHYFTFGGS